MFDSLSSRLSQAFKKITRRDRLSDSEINEVMREVRVALLEADVNIEVVKNFIQRVKDQAVGTDRFTGLNSEQTLIKFVRDELLLLLGQEPVRLNWSSSPPTVILVCGLQGAGKTTFCAKLAKWLLKQGKKPMLAACDIQRPAAIKQLEILGDQVGVPVFSKADGTSPSRIAKEALERCKYLLRDVLIVDTAGRLSIDEELMKELKEIQRVVGSSESLLVLDASGGQESVNIARSFRDHVELTGTVFNKLDGDTRGGGLLSVKSVLGIPIKFVGVGEGVDALEFFDSERMVGRILGLGDMLGLIEKVEQNITQEETKGFQSRLSKGEWSLEDMLHQIQMVKKMGPIKNVMKMLPRMNKMVPEGALEKLDDKKIIRIQAILQSMTPKERKNPDIINGSIRKRIAKGSGTTVQDVNQVLKQHEEMRKMVKQFSVLSQQQSKWMLNRFKR